MLSAWLVGEAGAVADGAEGVLQSAMFVLRTRAKWSESRSSLSWSGWCSTSMYS